MTYIENLWLFFVLLVGIIIVPGMDMLFVLTNSVTGGRRAGLTATAGMMAGGAFHTLGATIGVGILFQLMPSLLAYLVVAGAGYMAWIGISLVRSSFRLATTGTGARVPLTTIFRQAVTTCLLNPKAYLFSLAVYPQFLRPQFGGLWSQALVIGIMVAATQFTIYGGLAMMVAARGNFFAARPLATMIAGRLAGVVFVVVAVLTVWQIGHPGLISVG